jgi:hypothetical protein
MVSAWLRAAAVCLLLAALAGPARADTGDDDAFVDPGLDPAPQAVADTGSDSDAAATPTPTPTPTPAATPLPVPPPRLSATDPLNGGYLLVNNHGMLFHERNSDVQEDVSYARWLGAGVIRVFGTDNNGFRQWDGARVGGRIADIAPILRAARVKLIVAFVNNHRAVPGELADASGWLDNYSQLLLPFYTTDWHGAYLQFVRDLIGTVRTRGALDVVLAWELGNELHTPQNPKVVVPFITDALKEVRALDPVTPILPGTMGANHLEPGNHTSPIARWLYCEAPIDAYTLHAYDWLSRDRPGDMPIDWDLDKITSEPCPSGRQLPIIVEELGTSRELPGYWSFNDEQRRLDQEKKQIQFVRGFPRVVGFGVWNGESPRLVDHLFFDYRRGLTSYGAQAQGGGSCYDPRPDPAPGVRCQYETLLRSMRFLRTSPSGGWAAGSGADGGRPLLGGLDLPPADGSVALSLSGWVLDPSAVGSAGVDGVSVFLGGPADSGPLLGQARLGQSRMDVATRYANGDWSSSGFAVDLPLGLLPVGLTTLTVAAHSPDRGTWLSTVQVVAPDLGSAAAPPALPDARPDAPDVPSEPPRPAEVLTQRLQIDSPKAGATVGRTMLVQGIAFDPGVDEVDVFLEPDRDRGGRLIGSVSLRQPTPARFSVTITNLPPGPHTLYIHARSAPLNRESIVPIPVEGSG